METQMRRRARSAIQVSLALIVWAGPTVGARAQTQDQWERADKQLID
jgi:hypothetical protein